MRAREIEHLSSKVSFESSAFKWENWGIKKFAWVFAPFGIPLLAAEFQEWSTWAAIASSSCEFHPGAAHLIGKGVLHNMQEGLSEE